MEIKGNVVDVNIKEGISKTSGKPYKTYLVRLNDGFDYSTFDGKLVEGIKGKNVVIDFELSGVFRNITTLSLGDQTIEEVTTEANEKYNVVPTGKTDENIIDKRTADIHLQVCLKAVANVYMFPRPSEVETGATVQRIKEIANTQMKFLAQQAKVLQKEIWGE